MKQNISDTDNGWIGKKDIICSVLVLFYSFYVHLERILLLIAQFVLLR